MNPGQSGPYGGYQHSYGYPDYRQQQQQQQQQQQHRHLQLQQQQQHMAHSLPLMPMTGANNLIHNGDYRFELEVVQQPIRARMCGFGDKDRRQITPPPCVRLHIYSIQTGQEYKEISSIDTSFYALIVELWSIDGMTNMSLVNPSGQVSTSNLASSNASSAMFYNQHPGYPQNYYPQQGYPQQPSQQPPYPGSHYPHPIHPQAQHDTRMPNPAAPAPSFSTPHTRNLIGSLVATAFKLHDLSDTLGIWFILQDLSVRTEGEFRLKFSFVNLADTIRGASVASAAASVSGGSSNIHQHPQHPYQHPQQPHNNSAPIICHTFSEPFRSYSAKKFPGVIDSTELSRCFATQGIKIPIRREHRSAKDQAK